MQSRHFCKRDRVADLLNGKRIALVGSGPGSLKNEPGFVDGHEVVVRVNNYKIGIGHGIRTDVFYSYFGTAIRKTAYELRRDGTVLCMAKCPDAKPIESSWHERNGKQAGIDFRQIYERRDAWWFCDTYVPSVEEFMAHFELLGRHVPTTGFSALLDILSYEPASIFMTGFDFFESGIHNVRERWIPGNPADPIGHVPKAEAAWLKKNIQQLPITVDRGLRHRLIKA